MINFGSLANEPDSVYLFSYATGKNNHHNGLHFAWSHDKVNWHRIGNEFGYLKSDYGRWGSEKKMITPYLVNIGGVWHCVWSLNEKDKVFAHASSHDLVDWGRQSYPKTENGNNVLRPVVNYDSHCCPAKCRTVYSWIFTILPAIQNKIVYLALFEAKFVWLKVKF